LKCERKVSPEHPGGGCRALENEVDEPDPGTGSTVRAAWFPI
jgi:hypothetical protein